MPQLTLYQFPISHYCEKVRWVLDHKRLAYQVKNQLPGVHVLTNRRLVGRSTVPVLLDGHHAVGDSSEIALYLDDQFPDEPLIPHDEYEREAVLTLEEHFDERVGPAVRRLVYSYVATDLPLFQRVFFAEYGPLGALYGKLAGRVVAGKIAELYRLSPEAAEESRALVEAAFDRLEQLIGGNAHRYLVGGRLTLADVTVASLLGPLLGPARSPWTMEIFIPELLEFRDALQKRPGGRWVLERYERDRRNSRAA